MKSNKTDSIEKQSLPSVPTKDSTFERLLYITSNPNGSQSSITTEESSYDSGTSKNHDHKKKPSKMTAKANPRNTRSKINHHDLYPDSKCLCDEDGISLDKKESVLLPKLYPSEIEFLRLVSEDDLPAVRTFCLRHPALNINCVTFQGISALQIAVKNRSEAMVEFLLTQPNIEIGDTIMHAVRKNTIKILVKLLDAQKEICPGLEFTGSTHSPDFPEYMTPLMLAAHTGNFEVVELLVDRGHTIPQPHTPNCLCGECKQSLETEDALQASYTRLASYRAISAPAYLVHVTSDPIMAAFRLTRELNACAHACRQQAAEYLQLRDQVSTFAVDLMGCCRSSLEVEEVLKQKCYLCRSQFPLPRLLMAMDYKQKEFVAHPNTQLVLQSYWVENWFSWKSKTILSKGFIIMTRVFITPLILFMCIVAPRHRLVSYFQIPLNKLISHTSAYFVFLALVFYISNQDKTRQKRGPPNTGAEFPLVLFVLGFAWSALRMCVAQGPRRYFAYAWNLFDLTMIMLFGLTFAFWVTAAALVAAYDNELAERKYWDEYDPTLVAEGTFCLATIFAYLRLLSLFQLNYHLGPLQVSLGKMTVDIYQYLKVFAIIICAFAVGMARFYQYYDGMVREDETGMKTVQVSSFISLPDTLKTLFWALFCMSPLESADVVLDNRNMADKMINTRHTFTERIGYFCFGYPALNNCSYHSIEPYLSETSEYFIGFEVISVIVVLNMLIATMSNTYQRVIDNVTTEWTFGKTEMYLNYMYETTLPSPYNLVPTFAGLRGAAEWLVAGSAMPTKPYHADGCYIEWVGETIPNDQYAALIPALVQRYFRAKRSEHARDVKHEEQLVALRRELSSLKALLENRQLPVPKNN